MHADNDGWPHPIVLCSNVLYVGFTALHFQATLGSSQHTNALGKGQTRGVQGRCKQVSTLIAGDQPF